MMAAVSALSKEDSPICLNLVSLLLFLQIHEVKRVTALSSASCGVCCSATHPSPRGGLGEAGMWAGPPSRFSFLNLSSPHTPYYPRVP